MILALYGAGALGREFKYVADDTGQWSEMVFIDDHSAESSLLGCPVIGFQTFRKQYSTEDTYFVITIGEPKFRRLLTGWLRRDITERILSIRQQVSVLMLKWEKVQWWDLPSLLDHWPGLEEISMRRGALR